MPRALLLAIPFLAGCEAKTPVAATETVSEPGPVVISEPAAEPTPGMPTKPFQALGTEPFWSVEVTAGQMRYSDPENSAGTTFPAIEARQSRGMRYSGMLNGQPVNLVVQPGTCSDGMSDRVYAWKAQLTLGKRSLQGCARER